MTGECERSYGGPSVETSARMRRIRSKDTAPELLVRRYLHAQGFRFRLHERCLPGKPDLVLHKYKTVIFVQGCFWHLHGAGCRIKARAPRSNQDFWGPKLARTVARDAQVQSQLRVAGWQVLVVWECDLKQPARGATLSQLSAEVLSTLEPLPNSYEY